MKYMHIFNYMFTSVESSGDRGDLNGDHGVSVSHIYIAVRTCGPSRDFLNSVYRDNIYGKNF